MGHPRDTERNAPSISGSHPRTDPDLKQASERIQRHSRTPEPDGDNVMANDFAEVLRAVKDVGESVDENGTRFDKRFDEVNGKIDTLTNSDATNTRRLDSAIGRLDTIEKDRTERIKDNNDRWKDMTKEVEELKTQVTSWKGGTAVLFAAMTLIATGIAIWKGIH